MIRRPSSLGLRDVVQDRLDAAVRRRKLKVRVTDRYDRDGWAHFFVAADRPVDSVEFYTILADVEQQISEEIPGVQVLLVAEVLQPSSNRVKRAGGSGAKKAKKKSTRKPGRPRAWKKD